MKRHSLKSRGRDGFTLVEVLLAAVASAIILAAIFAVFSGASRLRNKAVARIDNARERMRAATILRNDLRNAWISGGTMAGVLNVTQQSQQSSFPGYLQFTTTSAELSDTNVGGDVQAVEYYIIPDPSSTNHSSGTLIRAANRVLLSTNTVTPPQQNILSRVTALTVTFFDGSNWQDTWQYAQAGDPLPTAIRVQVQQAPDDAIGQQPPIDVLIPWSTAPFTVPSTTNPVSSNPGSGNTTNTSGSNNGGSGNTGSNTSGGKSGGSGSGTGTSATPSGS